jgi:hypothetical protein
VKIQALVRGNSGDGSNYRKFDYFLAYLDPPLPLPPSLFFCIITVRTLSKEGMLIVKVEGHVPRRKKDTAPLAAEVVQPDTTTTTKPETEASVLSVDSGAELLVGRTETEPIDAGPSSASVPEAEEPKTQVVSEQPKSPMTESEAESLISNEGGKNSNIDEDGGQEMRVQQQLNQTDNGPSSSPSSSGCCGWGSKAAKADRQIELQ